MLCKSVFRVPSTKQVSCSKQRTKLELSIQDCAKDTGMDVEVAIQGGDVTSSCSAWKQCLDRKHVDELSNVIRRDCMEQSEILRDGEFDGVSLVNVVKVVKDNVCLRVDQN
ncbi:hypothetical protein HDU99_007648, partial [Rhizoclosmatium hyalinum]